MTMEQKADDYLGDMAHHPSKFHETVCPFADHGHTGTADEVLDQLAVCFREWETRQTKGGNP